MPNCPSDNTVALYVEGTLPTPRASSFRQHIDACDRCRALVADAVRSDGGNASGRFGVLPGQLLLGKYRVDDFIGAGGMGAVFRGRHVGLDLPIAIKAMHLELLADPAAIRRIAREARATAALTSPHTVRVLDIDRTPSGVPFIVMELLGGRDLDRVLHDDGVMSFERVIEIGVQACSALGEAHARGIVHRDLKPSNLILLADGTIKVVDFGLAKELSFARPAGESSDSRANMMIGSPHYMAPEQVRSAPVDARTDIWSLGATLYQLLCGARPFNGSTLAVLCSRILTDTFRPIEEKRPDIPVALRDVVVRCLEKSPDARFATAEELAASLQNANHGPTARRGSPAAPGSAPPTRRADPTDTVPAGPPSHPPASATKTWPSR